MKTDATIALQLSAAAYADAIKKKAEALWARDEELRALKDIETELFVEGINDGTIDGKNAETRDAQAKLLWKKNPQWQAVADRFRQAEHQHLLAQDEVTVTLTNLRVAAMIVNVEIAEKGNEKLLGEVALAGA